MNKKRKNKNLKMFSYISSIILIALGSISIATFLTSKNIENAKTQKAVETQGIQPNGAQEYREFNASILQADATGLFDSKVGVGHELNGKIITWAQNFVCNNFAFSGLTSEGVGHGYDKEGQYRNLKINQISADTADTNGGFANQKGLTGSLTFPSFITNIGAHAFYNCTGYNDPNALITIPTQIEVINSCAFKGTSFGRMQFLQKNTSAIVFEKNKCTVGHDSDWRPNILNKSPEGYEVYVPYGTRNAYSQKENFHWTFDQIHDGTLITQLNLDKPTITARVLDQPTVTATLDEGVNPYEEQSIVKWTSTDTTNEFIEFSESTVSGAANAITIKKATDTPITLTATINDWLGNTLTKTVTINTQWRDLTSVTIDDRTPTGMIGNTVNLVAKLNDGADYITNTISWVCSDASAVTFSKSTSASGEQITITLNKHIDASDNVSITATVTGTAIVDTVPLVINYQPVESINLTGGSLTLQGDVLKDGADTNKWTATVSPKTADPNVTYSVEPLPTKSVPNWLSITTDGQVKWTNPTKPGTYTFLVKAKSVGLSADGTNVEVYSQTITLVIRTSDIDNIVITPATPMTKNFKANTSGSIQFAAKVYPETANQDVTWSFDMVSGTRPNWLSIDANTGNLTWSNLCTKGEYILTVTATGKNADGSAFPVKTNNITLNIDYASITDMTINKPADWPTSSTWTMGESFTTAAWTATINPTSANQDVIWEIVNTSETMNGLKINPTTGIVEWDGTDTPGTYKFKVKATSAGFLKDDVTHLTKESEEFTINVQYAAPNSIRITQTPDATFVTEGSTGKYGDLNTPFKAEVLDAKGKAENVPQDVEWSISSFDDGTGATTTIPTWLHISKKGEVYKTKPLIEGFVYWDEGVTQGTYKIKVTATAKGTTIKTETTQQFTFKISDITVDDVTIDETTGSFSESGIAGIAGAQTTNPFAASVKLSDGTTSTVNVKWDIDRNTLTKDGKSYANIDWLSVKTDNQGKGYINWSDKCEKGLYEFRLVAIATQDQDMVKYTTKKVTLDIRYQYVESVVLDDSLVNQETNCYVNDGGQLSNSMTATINALNNQGICESGVTWEILNFKDKTSTVVTPTPTWLKVSDGLVSWDAGAKLGSYTFQVQATSVGSDQNGAKVKSNLSKEITLNIIYAPVDRIVVSSVSPSTTYETLPSTAGSMQFSAKVYGVNDKTCYDGVRWEIVVRDGSDLPSWISIDSTTGLVSWTDAIRNAGTFQFEVRAYSTQTGYETIYGTRNFDLIFKANPANGYDLTRIIEICITLGCSTLIFGTTGAIYAGREYQKDKLLIDALETRSPSPKKAKKTKKAKSSKKEPSKVEKVEQKSSIDVSKSIPDTAESKSQTDSITSKSTEESNKK